MNDLLHQSILWRAGSLLTESLREHLPVAYELACFHSLLACDRVPGGLVARHLSALGPVIRDAAAALPGSPEARAKRLLAPLFTHSFLLRLADTEDYATRPCLARLVREEMPPAEWRIWFARAVEVVGREAGHVRTPLERLRLLPHARELCRHARDAQACDPELAVLRQRAAALARLLAAPAGATTRTPTP